MKTPATGEPEDARPGLPPWGGGRPDLLIIAGEHSGDQHAARLVRGLLERQPELRVAALGGPELDRAGARLLYDLTASSVVGLAEVVRHYRFFRTLFDRTVEWIRVHRPRAVCMVDYPGFNLRLARRLRDAGISRKGGGAVAVHYYIGPQIWAWKAGRRFEMAETLDSLGVIFPFEVACYRDTALDVAFVGHPFVEPDYQLPVRPDAHGPALLLPGSRRQAVSRIFPPMGSAWERCRVALGTDRPALVLHPDPEIRGLLETLIASGGLDRSAFALAAAHGEASHPGSAVLTSSGTMSLVCALAGIPGAIVYRAHPLTYTIGRMVVRVPYLGIANLLLPEFPIYPEFIQGAARPDRLADELREAMGDRGRRDRAREGAARLHARLGTRDRDAPGWLLERMG